MVWNVCISSTVSPESTSGFGSEKNAAHRARSAGVLQSAPAAAVAPMSRSAGSLVDAVRVRIDEVALGRGGLLAHGRPRQAERLEDVLAEVLLPRLAGDARDDLAEQSEREIRIMEVRAGR